jgi:hypothetical protein
VSSAEHSTRWSRNPSGRTMALGSAQPLTEMRTRFIYWGKGGRCVRLTTLPPSCALVMESGNLNFMEPSGTLQACIRLTILPPSCAVVMKSGNLNFLEPSGPLHACNGTALPLPLPFYIHGCTFQPLHRRFQTV